ncbi:MAG: gluzincin family metallopeptidase [Candidatus Acidiferrales bacterium]
MTFSAIQRVCSGALVAGVLFCLSSCAVPLAPGYQIEKQSITVRFVPGNPPHLAIRAEYRLANVGTAPLDSIEIGLPSQKGFGRDDLRAKIDEREIQLQRESSPATTLTGGESAISETPPTVWRIPFASRWPRRQRRSLLIEYDLAAQATSDPRIWVGAKAFYLNDSGWFPDPLTPKALFAKVAVRPDPSDLIVDVPTDFVATASGEPRGTHTTRNETELRFRLRKNDFDPYVVAGEYQQQKVTTPDGAVVIWTFKPIPVAQAQQTGEQIAASTKFYAQTFGSLPQSIRAIYDVQVPEDAPTYANLEAAEGAFLPGVVYDWVLTPDKSFSNGIGNGIGGAIGQTALGYTWFGQMIAPQPAAWILRYALIAYASELQDEESNIRASRDDEIVSDLQDYDDEGAKAVEKPIAFLTPGDPEDQLRIGGDKSRLFFFALEDKCGRKNVEHAIAHMVYALRGQEYGYTDFRAALEQECHQDLSSFFDAWLDQKGIPADFRARYENKNKNTR